ncbi:DMT family transporter [Bacillus sp. Bva_UNVM-123]|uniref:DMT family transporter n=1 Tax=Bacillus sp. Bva_UNVM-123 TaxID=2829798 RepID=UPI00391F2665
MGKLYSALLLLSIIWGTSFLFIKLLLVQIGPAGIVFGRCLFGFITLALIVFIRRDKVNLKKLPLNKLFIVGFLNNALPWLLISNGQTKISSSLASIINATTPIWTLIIGSIFFASILKKTQWIGIVFGFVGILIISDLQSGELLSGHLSGVLFMLGAAVCYGMGTHLTKKYLADVSTLHISIMTLFFAMFFSFCFLLVSAPEDLLMFSEIKIILPFIGLGSLGSGVAYLLYYYLVKEGSPEFASLVTYLVPASAILWGAFLLKEEIHISMLIGLFVIFAGVFITSMKKKQTKTKAAA